MTETPDPYDPDDEIKAAEEYAARLRRKAEGDYADLRAKAVEIKRTLHTLKLQLDDYSEHTGQTQAHEIDRLVMRRLAEARPQ